MRINRDKKRYTKALRKPECTEANLPHNRFGVFWDCLKVRYDIFLKTAGILFLFALPLIVAILFYVLNKNSLISNYNNKVIDFDTYRSSFMSNVLLFSAIQSVCFLILAIGVSGLLRIIKRLVFYESIQFKEDFLRGIKTNIKHTLLLFLLIAICYFFSFLLMELAIGSASNDFASTIIFFLPLFAFLTFLLPMFLIALAEIPIYNNSFGENLKNAMIFYVRKFYITFPCLIIFLSPIALLLIPNAYALVISFVLVMLVLLPIEFIASHIYCTYLFDLYVNKQQYPQIVDKGIYRIKKEEKNSVDL